MKIMNWMMQIKVVSLLALISMLVTSCFPDVDDVPTLVEANFTTDLTVTQDEATVILNNTSSNATIYEWTFPGGNPESSTEETPGVITYTENGTYTITLVASDGTQTDTKTTTITISGISTPNDSVVLANFNVDLNVTNSSAAATLINTSNGATAYEWSFPGGNPESSTEENPGVVTYTENGTYTITLVASNGSESDTKSIDITISDLGDDNTDDIIVGEGDNATESFPDLTNFTGIKLNSAFEVNITESNTFSVEASGYSNLLPYLDFVVENDILVLQFEEGSYQNVNIVVDITLPSLLKVENNASTSMNLATSFSSENMEVILSGSGDISCTTALSITNNLNATCNGSGTIHLLGAALEQTLINNGSGQINGFFSSTNAYARIYGSGRIEVEATDYLDVIIAGSGNVYYKGNPEIGYSSWGSGSIIDAN